jgi:hypothetical protein
VFPELRFHNQRSGLELVGGHLLSSSSSSKYPNPPQYKHSFCTCTGTGITPS